MAQNKQGIRRGSETKLVKEFYEREPIPSVSKLTGIPAAGSSKVFTCSEDQKFEIKRVRFKGAPRMLITVKRKHRGTIETIMDATELQDLPIIDGQYVLEQRRVTNDVPLTIDRHNDLIFTYSHPYAGVQSLTIFVDKQEMRYIEMAREVPA